MTSQTPPFCKMEFKKDEKGRDVLIKDDKFQVMMEWEKPYMHACIDALHPSGDVLEVGFGLGYSATHIQSYHPKSHTIIEYHPEVAKKAREWARNFPHVTILENTWQDALDHLGIFDAIFFDDYPLESEEQLTRMEKESSTSQVLLKSGQDLIRNIEKQMPFLRSIRYTDEDLNAFRQQVPLSKEEEAICVVRFLLELVSHAQISSEQLDRQLQALVREGILSRQTITALLSAPPKKEPFVFSKTTDRCYQFLSRCLPSHMRIGSRFSCFLSSAQSKFEDETFFNEIIANPLIDFQEKHITLDVPDNCAYFQGKEALVITLTKRGDIPASSLRQ